MSVINKVLVVLDVYNDFRDDADHIPPEIDKAEALLANKADGQIYLIGCGFEEYLHDNFSNFSPDALEMRKEFVAEMEQRLKVIADKTIAKGYNVDCRVHWTYPRYEQIAKEAEELNVDLVIQHIHTQKFVEAHNLSHDSWQLVKTCNKPMLLIKNTDWPETPVILAAVDPVHSHHKPGGLDHSILNIAKDASDKLGGELHVVHAYSGSARPFAPVEAIHDTHNEAMHGLLQGYALLPANVHLLDEKPATAIMKCVDDQKANITALGVLSRSRLSDAIIGNTADKVLDYIHSDLLIVKP